MKIMSRDIATGIGCFDLPIHPNWVVESVCPQCGGVAFPDPDVHSAYVNFGSSREPSMLEFTCYNQLADGSDCDYVWNEHIVIRVSLELPTEGQKE